MSIYSHVYNSVVQAWILKNALSCLGFIHVDLKAWCKHSPQCLSSDSPRILFRASILALHIGSYGYKNARRSACWSRCVWWSCLVGVKNQYKKPNLKQASIYRTTLSGVPNSVSFLQFCWCSADAFLACWRLGGEKIGCVVRSSSEVMGICQQTLQGNSLGKRTGLQFTGTYVIPFSQSREKGKEKMLLATSLLWVPPTSALPS